MSTTFAADSKKPALTGWISGFLGMTIFSGSLPATRLALAGFDPMFLTLARASVAGLLALALILLFRQRWPRPHQLLSLLVVAGGVVIGFPLLTALALQRVSSAHSVVFLALLPLSTALFAVLRGGERPRPLFWLFSASGSLLVAGFAFSGGIDAASVADLLMLAAVLVCGLGYAEGARLARTLGSWQVICWALIVALPLMLPGCGLMMPDRFSGITLAAWLGLGYVTLFSMLIGFIFWYRGLALGGTAAVGQLQLLQPFFALMLSALLLHDGISPLMLIVTLGVMACVTASRKFV